MVWVPSVELGSGAGDDWSTNNEPPPYHLSLGVSNRASARGAAEGRSHRRQLAMFLGANCGMLKRPLSRSISSPTDHIFSLDRGAEIGQKARRSCPLN
ncbi:MAG: hypothetical protein CMJ59_05975 [Planctomycetaceae bacterium]|nr:hypothetical protein [Planctomycetaceae bacterium]